MNETPSSRNRTWLLIPILSIPAELFLWSIFAVVLLVGDVRYGLTQVGWVIIPLYPVWRLISLVLQIRAYRRGQDKRVVILSIINVVYLFVVILVALLIGAVVVY